MLDNDILGLKKRLDAIRWTKDKKLIKVEEQTKELESMKRIYDSVTEEIHKDPIWKKARKFRCELATRDNSSMGS